MEQSSKNIFNYIECNYFYQISMILISVIIAIMAIWCTRNPPVKGDGIEYLGMSISFVNHGSPDLRKEDLEEILAFGNNNINNAIEQKKIQPALEKGIDAGGYFRANDDRYYSYHFWLYSLVNAPSLIFTKWLKIDPLNSFLFTNIVFLLLASTLAAQANCYSVLQRWGLIAFIWLGGSSLYVFWSSPEVFTFSLMVISGIALKEKKYFLTAFCLAVAAQQNPPIGILSVIVLLLAVLRLLRFRSCSLKLTAGLINFLSIAAVLMLSPAFYSSYFNTPSLIAAKGFASAANISIEKLASFFLDLNQGMIVFLFGLIVGSCVAVFYIVIYKRFNYGFLKIIVLSVLWMVILAVPSLSNDNLNNDANGMMRYALWCMVPAGFAFVELMRYIKKNSWCLLALGGFIFAQTMLFFFYCRTPFNSGYTYLEMSPATRFALRYFPEFYSPIIEIFIERGIHVDGYQINPDETYFYVKGGRVIRVLFNRTASPIWLPVCPQISSVIPPARSNSSNGWTYVSPKQGGCPVAMSDGFHVLRRGEFPPSSISGNFSIEKNHDLFRKFFLGDGWSQPESKIVWMTEREAHLFLNVGKGFTGALMLDVAAFLPHPDSIQNVFVYANNNPVAQIKFSVDKNQQRVFIPFKNLMQDVVDIKFVDHDLVSPKAAGISADPRTLGVQLWGFNIQRQN
jgi:hypothetical protein